MEEAKPEYEAPVVVSFKGTKECQCGGGDGYNCYQGPSVDE